MNNHAKYQRLLDACKGLPPTPTAVVHPCDEASIEGAIGAGRLGLIKPILIGPQEKIREAMRIEPPKVEAVAPKAAGHAGDDYPGSPYTPAADAPASTEPPATEPPATAEPVPETVSRQPDDTPIEPK